MWKGYGVPLQLSLIASSVRHWLWPEFCESLIENTIDFEVVFVGSLDAFQVRPYLAKYPFLRYIHTGNIKPAQCYEIARRNATGEAVHWTCDDGEYAPGLLDRVWEFYASAPNKSVVSIRTNENNSRNQLDNFRLIGNNQNTPLMAPLGLMGRVYLQELGGFDQRFLCGQYENDVVMRVRADGGKLFKFDRDCIAIEHTKKHGTSTKFWSGFEHDRRVLEETWIGHYQPPPKYLIVINKGRGPSVYGEIDNREVSKTPLIPFHPYSIDLSLTKSEGPCGQWE